MALRVNVGSGERWLRMCAGVLMVASGLFAMRGMAIGYLVAASGCITLVTGIFRWCPMCAVSGPSNRSVRNDL